MTWKSQNELVSLTLKFGRCTSWSVLLLFACNMEYKSLSWVWARASKFCPEDHRLASRGLQSNDKRWSRGTDFPIPFSHK